jgi:transcriptional regulator with XRE-family HTH domain
VKGVLARLGNRIRELRTARGLTLEAAAERADLDDGHLQAIETGQSNPTVASLAGIARSLGVSLEELFRGV